jgi:hypothetical protein
MGTAKTLAEAAQKAVAAIKGEAGVIQLPPVEVKPLAAARKVSKPVAKKPTAKKPVAKKSAAKKPAVKAKK